MKIYANPLTFVARIRLRRVWTIQLFCALFNRSARPRAVRKAPGEVQYFLLGRTFRATSAGKTPSEVMMRTGRSLPDM